ncbi:MAG TPA: hypothetical protein VNW53_16045 [Phenylobacterium sp.]|jgi:hypothetical protein|uniref:hypothetical protein n=1 Tax=Phenylobacterium sp. TaxID=1871053 RepID=UPI002CEEE751|nr:hypothetical protein [Phenylobacterium sp.]HXA40510.1 hypothetical protein [Phenylobacterium sp.]
MPAQRWAAWIGLGLAAVVVLAVLGFYAGRLAMPLPLFAADEAVYLIRALYPDGVVALDPSVASANDGVHLSVIRAVYGLGAPVVVGDRLVNAAAYLAGLALVWRACAARLPRLDQAALGLLALGFPYYRFAFSNLAEGLFVAVLALLCVATGRWYRSRPVVHALLAGVLAAALVLVKPNGIAAVAALAAVMAADAWASGRWRILPLRLALLAASFLAVGNLIQFAAEEPVANPLTFFVSRGYGGDLAMAPPPGAWRVGLLQAAAMASAAAVLAGVPLAVGLTDLAQRRRARRGRFEAEGTELVFLLLALALAATVAMVTLFAMQVAWTPSETKRLWGRYFEFFAPLLWLAAGPALARPVGRRTAWACAGLLLAGLLGLLASFHAGIVLFPWDAGALTAFFRSDPVRAPLNAALPYRALAAAAVLLAAAALASRARPLAAGLGLVLALSALSTSLDHAWTGQMIAQRNALERDLRAIAPALPRAGTVVLLTPDANIDHLVFLRLEARPRVWSGEPGQAPAVELADAAVVLASGPQAPPGPWVRAFQGEELSLFRRQETP